MQRRYITALFADRTDALHAAGALEALGVPPDDICAAARSSEDVLPFCERTHAIPLQGNVSAQLHETGFAAEHAAFCDEQVRGGALLLLVRVSRNEDEVRDALRQAGAQTSSRTDITRIPIRSQRLKVRKQRRVTAHVDIKKVITRSVQHLEVPLEAEDLIITRTPTAGRPEVMRIPLWHEEAQVRKRNVVVNEVTIRRDTRRTIKQVTEPVLSEKLVVRQDGSLPAQQVDKFRMNATGNTTSLKSHLPMESHMDLQKVQSISAYFSDRPSAEAAADAIQQQGISPQNISLESSGETFLQTVKRLFGAGNGSAGSENSGCVLYVQGADPDVVLPVIDRFGGKTDTGTDSENESESGTMTLHEERLDVQKHEAKQGEVRLGKQVVSSQEELDIPVNREEIVLTRHRVDREDDDASIGQGEEIRIPVMRDEVSVDKHTVATEEVGVEKRDVQSTEHVSATVKKERARLETDGRVGTTLNDER